MRCRLLPDIESIRCFLSAARTLNFRAASKDVALTPAAFGKRIKQLEDLFDVKLFERTTRHVRLTPAGQRLVPEARKLVSVAEECMRIGRGGSGPAPMTVTIGTRHELGISWLVPMLDRLNNAYPHLTINYYFGSGPDIEAKVRAYDIDCAVSSRVFVDPVFRSIRLKREDYVLVAAKSLLRRLPFDSADDAGRHCLLDVQAEQPLFRYFRDAESAPDAIQFKTTRILGTTAAIRLRVLAEKGVSVLPLYLVKPDLDAGRLVRLFPEVTLRCDYFRLIFRKDDPNAETYRQIADLMQSQPLT